MVKICVMDGQGGNLGRQLAKLIGERFPDAELMVVGTNSMATANMMKAGVTAAATGENAVIVACRKVDIIVGPIGLVIADALMGEVTPAMAIAVGQSPAQRVLIPMNRCDTYIAGVENMTVSALIEDGLRHVERLLSGR